MQLFISIIIFITLPFSNNLMSQTTKIKSEAVLVDQSGNTYKTVKIGTNVWMAENFKAKHFSNGDPIPEHILKIDKNGNELTNFDGNKPFFSVLPNGNYVYSGGAISDPRGIAPIGWHLSSEADWQDLKHISSSSNDFKSISGWSPIIYAGYYPTLDCPICKNWNSEYRSNKRGCDRCQDTRQINGKYIPKQIISINGNNRLKFNLQDVGFIEEWHLRSSSASGSSFIGNNDKMSAYWTSDEDKSIYERGPVCLVIPQNPYANDFPQFENYRKKHNLLPVRLVKNKEMKLSDLDY